MSPCASFQTAFLQLGRWKFDSYAFVSLACVASVPALATLNPSFSLTLNPTLTPRFNPSVPGRAAWQRAAPALVFGGSRSSGAASERYWNWYPLSPDLAGPHRLYSPCKPCCIEPIAGDLALSIFGDLYIHIYIYTYIYILYIYLSTYT